MYYPQNQRNKRDELDSVPVKQALPQHTNLPDIQAIGQTKRLVVRPYISYENDPDVEREYNTIMRLSWYFVFKQQRRSHIYKRHNTYPLS